MADISLPDRSGPTDLSARSLAPDLARGAMLLFIALANSHYFLRGETVLGGFPQAGSVLDSVVTGLIATFVDGRAYPMFGLLFGYGLARIVDRQQSAGSDRRSIRSLLRRRGLFLVVLGFLHAVLLYVGDILAAYGVLLLVAVWVLWWKDRTLLVAAALAIIISALPSDASLATSADQPDASMLPEDPIAGFAARIVVQPFIALLGPIGFICPLMLGLWAGRRRILEQPERHLPLLRLTAVLGIGCAVLGGLPVALVIAGVIGRPSDGMMDLLGPLHDATGYFGGFGYAAAIALLAVRIGARRGRAVLAVSAVGQRSLTCYLAQSVIWTAAFAPYAADLSGTLTVAGTALLATGTWLLTVVMAELMRRANYRGPFEVLIRRFTYRRRTEKPARVRS